jgi:hypothetical protein
MNTERRYIECFVFVAAWMAFGWIFHPSVLVYQMFGIPLLVLFQLVVARRSLSQLWVRKSEVFRLDRAGAVLSAVLMLPLVFAAVKHRDSWEQMFFYILAAIGAVPAAFALRHQHVKQLRAALPTFAAVVGIGWFSFVVYTLHIGHSPVAGLIKLPSIGLDCLLLFTICFVIEEVAFRGVLDTHVAPISGNDKPAWMSAVFVSALWGLWHFPLCQNGKLSFLAISLTAHILVGVPLSFCWRQSGTLVLPAAAHALIDAYRDVILHS